MLRVNKWLYGAYTYSYSVHMMQQIEPTVINRYSIMWLLNHMARNVSIKLTPAPQHGPVGFRCPQYAFYHHVNNIVTCVLCINHSAAVVRMRVIFDTFMTDHINIILLD